MCWYSSFWCHFNLVKQVKFGISRIFFVIRMHGRSGLKFDILMYPDHLWNCLHLGHSLLVFLLSPYFDWNRSNVQFPGIFMTMYGRNGLKFVMFISILWYPQKWTRQILAHENYPVTSLAWHIILKDWKLMMWLVELYIAYTVKCHYNAV